ncbi:MAG: PaaI family thioesterase [Cycloclasticus sp.]|nr:PaaI family thioesterase [Cycloclasticus sp.]MBQ0790771.1 PaaI family thioesterase [Cycloclasticus sp.]
MNLVEKINAIKENQDDTALVELIPYANFIGVQTKLVNGNIISSLPFKESNVGNPAIPALHGGAIAGFMENAALFHLLWQIELITIPKIIDFSIDYLLPGRSECSYSQCEIIRLGRRIALCNIKTWQDNDQQPIALARAHFLLSENDPVK